MNHTHNLRRIHDATYHAISSSWISIYCYCYCQCQPALTNQRCNPHIHPHAPQRSQTLDEPYTNICAFSLIISSPLLFPLCIHYSMSLSLYLPVCDSSCCISNMHPLSLFYITTFSFPPSVCQTQDPILQGTASPSPFSPN